MSFDAEALLAELSTRPGVYMMLDAKGKTLYVGKAKNLKRRVSSYFRKGQHSLKTKKLVEKIANIDVMITESESAALILEATLIKERKPPFNILLRDDKSYPYIYFSKDKDFPRLDFYRGRRKEAGSYFGPYPSVSAVRQTLNLLQKLFRVRQCSDSYFRHRQRPCLQHQIGRCRAPCVGLVSPEDYQQDVANTVLFLEGKNEVIISALTAKMKAAAEEKNYEQAAQCRDQVASLRTIETQQYVTRKQGNVDIVTFAIDANVACVHVLMVRRGHVLGSRNFFPRLPLAYEPEEILSAFLMQHYLNRDPQEIPKEIVLDAVLSEQQAVEKALSEQAGYGVKIRNNVRTDRAHWLAMAKENVIQALQLRLAQRKNQQSRLHQLEQSLNLSKPITRLECFDVSHTQGEQTVASCVVFDPDGPAKNAYRRFNIKDVTPGDDYGALRQALLRRYQRLINESQSLPDIVLIDGGEGQLKQAESVFAELEQTEVLLLAIAKGSTRKAGMERILMTTSEGSIELLPEDKALNLLQHIRDEAHRFAISGHRKQRDRRRKQSVLENIPGVGAQRRQLLLNHFGGLSEVKAASIEALKKVPGIHEALAERIFSALHDE